MKETLPDPSALENTTYGLYLKTHLRFAEQFRLSQGLGAARTIASRYHHSTAYSEDYNRENEGQRLKVKNVELIGWFESTSDHVYMSLNTYTLGPDRRLLTRKELIEKEKNRRRRALDSFQEQALKRLRGGEKLLLSTDRSRMVGGLYATGKCLKCHHVPSGTLIGALSYELHPMKQ
ncbi:MAG: hypothetical protein P1V97_36815 [Planctomycetota bacterium]|nr:hypothetical protein [Planctomycetota bacterium]